MALDFIRKEHYNTEDLIRIVALLRAPGGCSPIKVVRELGSERRETVRSLSIAGVRNLKGAAPSTRGPEWTDQWCTSHGASRAAG